MGPLKIITLAALLCSALPALLASPIDQDYIDDAFETGEIEKLDPGILPTEETRTKEDQRLPVSPKPPALPISPAFPISLPHEDMSAESISLYAILSFFGFTGLAALARFLFRLHQAGRLGFHIADEAFDFLQLLSARLRHGFPRPGPIALQ